MNLVASVQPHQWPVRRRRNAPAPKGRPIGTPNTDLASGKISGLDPGARKLPMCRISRGTATRTPGTSRAEEAVRSSKEGRRRLTRRPFACRGHMRHDRARSLGERRLADRDQQVMPHLSGEHVVLVLKPGKLGFQVTYSLLQAAHL